MDTATALFPVIQNHLNKVKIHLQVSPFEQNVVEVERGNSTVNNDQCVKIVSSLF